MPTSVAVFCGSYSGNSCHYMELTRDVGTQLARHGITLVYGGGAVGLMGVVADAALAAGGRVVGVMPQSLVDAEINHPGLSELHIVDNMHTRKQLMSDLSDAFITLPGGADTLEEITEQWTWAQLGFHAKPCGFLATDEFYEPLRSMSRHMVDAGFMKPEYHDMLLFDQDVETLLARFAAYVPPPEKWAGAARHAATTSGQ